MPAGAAVAYSASVAAFTCASSLALTALGLGGLQGVEHSMPFMQGGTLESSQHLGQPAWTMCEPEAKEVLWASTAFYNYLLSGCTVGVRRQNQGDRLMVKHAQDGYIEERSALGPVNLTVPGSGAGVGAALPLRLLDGFSLYTEDANGAEEIVSLQMLQNGRAGFAQSHNLANRMC